MKCSINEREFMLFKDYIEKKSGIDIKPDKAYLIETRLSMLMLEAGLESFDKFYNYLISGADPGLPQKIIDAITINETMWFRDAALWKLLDETVVPRLAGEIASGKKSKARIWCSAVSTGQEAYSAAICVDDYLNRSRIK